MTDAKSFWPLALLNSTYYWYLVTEGQITPLFSCNNNFNDNYMAFSTVC